MEGPRGRKGYLAPLEQIDIDSCLPYVIPEEMDKGKVRTSILKHIGRVLKH